MNNENWKYYPTSIDSCTECGKPFCNQGEDGKGGMHASTWSRGYCFLW